MNITPEKWSNWSGSVTSRPQTIAMPATEAALIMLLQQAAHENRSVRVVGTGHSFVPLCATDDLLISLAEMQGLIAASVTEKTATFWAGTKLHAIGDPLWAEGLALANMGDIDRQSLGGAIGTGTHGTGPTLGNLSTQVIGLRLITASGEIVDCSSMTEPAIFEAARLSLGALGIITQVTLRCLPAYYLQEKTWAVPFEECMATLDQQIAATRHFEFFWIPDEDLCAMKALHPVDKDAVTVPGTPSPTLTTTPALSRYIGEERIDHSYRIFPSERNRKFNEIEFAVPAEYGLDCLCEIRQLMQTRYPDVTWPIEYRTLAADHIPLSPAYGRATVTISVHQAAELPYQPFFTDVEAIFRNYQGRPHWGKIHIYEARELESLYPQWHEFQQVRKALDPTGQMLNSYLQEILLSATD